MVWCKDTGVYALLCMIIAILIHLLGMERLCVCSAEGKLHFYQLCEDSPVLSDSGSLIDVPDGLCNGETPIEPEPSTSTVDSSESRDTMDKSSPGISVIAVHMKCIENYMKTILLCFSSLDLIPKVTFSNRRLSIVCKLFIFPSSQEPLAQFQPNLAQVIF